MSELTAGVLCAGFGGVEIGMIDAGVKPIWSIEVDADIAGVAQENFDHKVMIADILDIDPSTLEKVDILHVSPPCPNFSIAKQGGKEMPIDIALARKITEFVTVLKPRIFTLENVYQYRKSKSWTIILESLYANGYMVDVQHVNAADYGVPQSRKRMIVRSILGGFVPYLPAKQSWVGWYKAIEDLIPSLPDSQFAPWQVRLIPNEYKTFLCSVNGENSTVFDTRSPAPTITTGHSAAKYRAFLMRGENAKQKGMRQVRYVEESAMTITGSAKPKAFVVDGQVNAFSGDKNLDSVTNRDGIEPIFTIAASAYKRPARVMTNQGRVVSMTPRALAIFQSFPDWYTLPSGNGLACKGIGNAVPPLLYQNIIGGLI